MTAQLQLNKCDMTCLYTHPSRLQRRWRWSCCACAPPGQRGGAWCCDWRRGRGPSRRRWRSCCSSSRAERAACPPDPHYHTWCGTRRRGKKGGVGWRGTFAGGDKEKEELELEEQREAQRRDERRTRNRHTKHTATVNKPHLQSCRFIENYHKNNKY